MLELNEFLALCEKFGWPAGLYFAYRAGKVVTAGACYVWSRVEPKLLGILSSHDDLMKTATEQMPKQTAILQELSAGQREHSSLLSQIHTSVRSMRDSDPNVSARADGDSVSN